MTFPRWFFYVAGAVLVLSGVVRLIIAWPRERPLSPKTVEPGVPLSKYPRQIGMTWSAVYVAVGVLVILYAAGVIPGPGGR